MLDIIPSFYLLSIIFLKGLEVLYLGMLNKPGKITEYRFFPFHIWKKGV